MRASGTGYRTQDLEPQLVLNRAGVVLGGCYRNSMGLYRGLMGIAGILWP